MKIRRYTSTNNRITSQIVDTDDYVWLAYLGSSGTCKLKKVSTRNPSLVYFDLTIAVDEITQMEIYGDYLYCSCNSSSYIGIKIDKDNPLGSGNISYFTKPGTTTEQSVAVAIDSTYVYFLVPGNGSGIDSYAKIFKFNKSTRVLSATYDLTGEPSGDVRTACATMVIKSGYLWVFTNEDPTKWIRVDVSNGDYTFGTIQ